MSGNDAGGEEIAQRERNRIITFIVIQVFFLAISPLAGGFNYKVWSMIDSSLLVLSIGITGLMLVLESKRTRDVAFRAAVVLYVLAVLDMSVNILVSGWTGWHK